MESTRRFAAVVALRTWLRSAELRTRDPVHVAAIARQLGVSLKLAREALSCLVGLGRLVHTGRLYSVGGRDVSVRNGCSRHPSRWHGSTWRRC